jgi:hypothetical protein
MKERITVSFIIVGMLLIFWILFTLTAQRFEMIRVGFEGFFGGEMNTSWNIPYMIAWFFSSWIFLFSIGMFENYVNKKQMKKIEDKYKEDLE